MAKDPATLWYWNDWIGGTLTMTRQAKGAYMDILTAQFNSGHLTETQIKTLLGQDQGLWATVLREKFLVDGDGKYYNQRLNDEIERRRAFSKKQSENGKKGGRQKGLVKPTLKPERSLIEDEDESKIEFKNGGPGEMDIDLIVEKIMLDKNYREQCEIAGYPPAKLDRWMYAFNRFLKFKGVVKNTETHWRLGFPAWMAYHEYRNGEDPDAYSPVIWAKQKKEDADKILKLNGTTKSNSAGSATARSVASLLSGTD